MKYNFEYERKIRVGFIGAGGHSFRNVYPTFQYAPVELVAVCDKDGDRAAAFARQFGATASHTDHHEMLANEELDAVFIVTSYDEAGRPQSTPLALDALAAGCHVWMEKPTAGSVADVRALIEGSERADRFVMSGLKKMFFPSIVRAREIIDSEEFGQPTSMYIRYPQSMPPLEDRGDLTKVRGLLDHIYHPGAIINYLMGEVESMSYLWESITGGSVTNLRFASGAVGTFHMPGANPGTGLLERLEVVGEGTSVVVDNGVKVTYHRKATRPAYGRSASFLVDNDSAALTWEPEFSLGQLYNKNIFYLGYVPEVLHFCESVLTNTAPTKGTLGQSLELAKLFEAYCTTPAGTEVVINTPA